MRVKLNDITKYSKGTQINGDSLLDEGNYIYLNGGINPSGRWNSANVNGNTVTISEGGILPDMLIISRSHFGVARTAIIYMMGQVILSICITH